MKTDNVFKNWRVFIFNLIVSMILFALFIIFIFLFIWFFALKGYIDILYYAMPHPPYPPFKRTFDITADNSTIECDFKTLIKADYAFRLVFKYQNTEVILNKQRDIYENESNEVKSGNLFDTQEAHLLRMTVNKILNNERDELYFQETINLNPYDEKMNDEHDLSPTWFPLKAGRYRLIIDDLNKEMPAQVLNVALWFPLKSGHYRLIIECLNLGSLFQEVKAEIWFYSVPMKFP